MRLGVLDVGSNTVHLLVVDAHRGAHPTPMSSIKTMLRLAEQLDRNGRLTRAGSDNLVRTVAAAKREAAKLGCDDLMAFATSAVREAGNSAAVLQRVRKETGVDLKVLSGADEARYTFLAVRRWFGWSAGRLLVVDIGGGSLELATGMDEDPELAFSVPLGAGRLTRTRFRHDPPTQREIKATRDWLTEELAEVARVLRKSGAPDRAVASSKTFRTLARLTGAAPSSAGPRVSRVLTDSGLRQLTAFISRMSAADLAELEGVSASRSHQLVAGALVAEAAMRALSLPQLEICPWALREGVILRRLDQTDGDDHTVSDPGGAAATNGSGPDAGQEQGHNTGRMGQHGARWNQ
ncbi:MULTISPECIES: Ppx/GppA phosphatase family protein [unclassified Crossiella]|uniref:Ppx/GppA phosphatase family protein n=1 Tax=unclassified Crossiella TaxID=2620835 RepID=UPI001FFE3591|nr:MULTISPECIES: Ppx/GppA phosphatase family protein [unclassified Crossiella]MCK2236702.1 Ppx/GppA family phosphatase [Crossiella sp. S99.2]MCK2250370.1 Ppx/GppA family phosphatase [Crossiella sp. S99.1]